MRHAREELRMTPQTFRLKPCSAVLNCGLRLFDPSGHGGLITDSSVSGGRCQVLTFVAGAQAEVDEQEQQRPHVHIENWTDAVQHVKRRRQENLQRIPTSQRPASCSRNKGGFFWESLPWGESDPGGCASSCGSTVTRSWLPVWETGGRKDGPVPASMIL